MNKQKGLAPILIVLLIALGIGGYLIYQNQNKSIPLPQQTTQSTPTPLSTSESTTSAQNHVVPYQAPTPTSMSLPSLKNQQTDKIYLVNKLNDDKIILMDAPEDAEVKSQNEIGYITSTVKINDSLYSVSSQAGGRGGPCPRDDFGTKCGYTDDKIDLKVPLKIEAVRVWKNEKGIFLINPWDIHIGDQGINSILITKLQPNNIFSPNEVNLWKQLLTTIQLQ